jgi:FAD/FMN-containing dehydrogenase
VIARGMGRSYGDSALNDRVILTRRFDKILGFNSREGTVTCESGVSLADLVSLFLPRGWFLWTTPGTRLITVGGAIASDVHGKNHHTAGCFSEGVLSFELMLPSGAVVSCSRETNPALFRATCGGMGLTGVILTAVLKLRPVKSAFMRETVIRCRNLEEVFAQFEANAGAPYSVAWIDCLAKGRRLGRSVLMLGRHAAAGRLTRPSANPLSVPPGFPGFFLNSRTVSIFNRLYYHTRSDHIDGRRVPLETYFYPLDRIHNWNRLYGQKGFTQYQLVLPKDASREGLEEILKKIAAAGLGSFLAVLKLMGAGNDNYLSFPMRGYTLALDFKINPALFSFLDSLDRIVTGYGGRVYLTKDVRLSEESFKKGYPRWRTFLDVRETHGMMQKFNSRQSRRLGV